MMAKITRAPIKLHGAEVVALVGNFSAGKSVEVNGERYVLATAQDPFRTAILTIIKSMKEYLPPDSGVSKDQFISEVIGSVDNPAVFAALHGTSDAGNDSLKRALERDK